MIEDFYVVLAFRVAQGEMARVRRIDFVQGLKSSGRKKKRYWERALGYFSYIHEFLCCGIVINKLKFMRKNQFQMIFVVFKKILDFCGL